MKVLVAGANGFIGINMVKLLLEKGHEVIMTYRRNLTDANRELIRPYRDQVTEVVGDLMDPELFRKLEGIRADGIVNAAIYTSTGPNELDFFIPVCRVNTETNINLMEYAIRTGVSHYVYVSSSGVYGSASDIDDIVTEESALDLPDAYDRTKVASEMLVTRMKELTGMSAASARIAAPYGPGEHVTKSRVYMSPAYRLVHLAAEGKHARIFFPEYRRDWTYVADTCDGLYRLLTAESLPHTVYNVSSSRNASIRDIAEAVRHVCPSFTWEEASSPEDADTAGDAADMRGALSTDRLAGDTGYRPRYDVEKGIAEYYRIVTEMSHV